jgi:hypothetical protein
MQTQQQKKSHHRTARLVGWNGSIPTGTIIAGIRSADGKMMEHVFMEVHERDPVRLPDMTREKWEEMGRPVVALPSPLVPPAPLLPPAPPALPPLVLPALAPLVPPPPVPMIVPPKKKDPLAIENLLN